MERDVAIGKLVMNSLLLLASLLAIYGVTSGTNFLNKDETLETLVVFTYFFTLIAAFLIVLFMCYI